MLYSPNHDAIKAYGSKLEREFTEKFHSLDNAYFNMRSKDYGNMARKAFKEYEDANSHYRELVTLGVSSEILEVEVAIVRAKLSDYHRYERLCAEYGIRGCL